MSAMPTLLDPLRFCLRGRSLIEASAGTGKTFTIAALYLRLVLGHGGEDAFPAALTPPQVLVVTFTEAATKELRDRIRARLSEAAGLFLLDPAAPPPADADPLLLDLRASYPQKEWAACGQRLRVAAEWMDEAAISTIHGWCHRMLREHAFDSGSLFHQELLADTAELEDEAVHDYWRKFFYPLAGEDAACVARWWTEPARLLKQLKDLLPNAQRVAAAPTPAESLAAARAEQAAHLAAMRAPWVNWCEELQKLLDDARDAGCLDGKQIKKVWYDGWLKALRDWCTGATDSLALSDAARERLSAEGLAAVWKPRDKAPTHPAFDDLKTLAQRLGCLPEGKHQVLAHAARWVAGRIAEEKQRRAQVGFDDMLTQLRDALAGPNGSSLAQLIRRQFPVALIDEFQDTDPVQYAVFRAVYAADAPGEETALVLIGDPKQAIYAFRGADIHTYLAARRDTAGRHETLGTNYRSTHAMVQAVNHLFLQAEKREGEGAFLFRTRDEDPLPFVEVQAKGRKEEWVVEGKAQKALTCWWMEADGESADAADYIGTMAGACAAEIVRLLILAQDGKAGFRGDGGQWLPLEPKDIAVLVNGRNEADAVREALRALGVRSVYLSDRGNVYQSRVAAELQRLLRACAAPDDGRLVRAALATPLLGLGWAELDRLNTDEPHWERTQQRFRGYRARWQQQGVLPMLRRLLHDHEVPARLVAARQERELTDLLHLAELLQQASAQFEGEHALVRFLAEQRQAAVGDGDQRQLRLESDAELLKVVTVHKSKGLEYPLVFVPFPCNFWAVNEESLPVKWHDEAGELHVTLEPDATQVATADRERLGEDLRKLYVALTRARHATWIGLKTQGLQQSAIGYLLAGAGSLPPGGLQELLANTLGSSPHVAIAQAPAAATQAYQPRRTSRELGAPRVPRTPDERWWIASYSRLRGDAGSARHPVLPAPESASEETFFEPGAAEAGEQSAAPAAAGTLHALPAGAMDGTLLHALLEWAGRKGFAAAAQAPGELAREVARRTRPARWRAHRQLVQDWLQAWLESKLDLSRLQPGALPVAPRDLQAVQVEMEFWFGASHVDARKLDGIVCRHTLQGLQRPPLQPQQVNGMLKGFIDLVFAHEGRYYVADYKSNKLGRDDGAYHPAAMREAVLHHRYDLQYALYLFALHRHLRSRLGPAYDYDRHVGGAVYVFLRGHAAPSGGLHLEKPPAALMDELDALFGAAGTA